MKKLFVMLLSMLLLTACVSQPVAGFVQLPDAEQIAITALVVGVLGLVFSYIATKFPWSTPFVEKYKMEISLAAAGALVGVIENALPSAYPEISILFVQLVLAVLAVVGLFKILGKAGVPGFRA